MQFRSDSVLLGTFSCHLYLCSMCIKTLPNTNASTQWRAGSLHFLFEGAAGADVVCSRRLGQPLGLSCIAPLIQWPLWAQVCLSHNCSAPSLLPFSSTLLLIHLHPNPWEENTHCFYTLLVHTTHTCHIYILHVHMQQAHAAHVHCTHAHILHTLHMHTVGAH